MRKISVKMNPVSYHLHHKKKVAQCELPYFDLMLAKSGIDGFVSPAFIWMAIIQSEHATVQSII
jgi:hypothetical protein